MDGKSQGLCWRIEHPRGLHGWNIRMISHSGQSG
jgi:hypothetical protein